MRIIFILQIISYLKLAKNPFAFIIPIIILGLTSTVSVFSQNYCVVGTNQNKFYSDHQVIKAPEAGQDFYGQDPQFPGPTPAYKDNGDGTISDLNTGLMWVKERGQKMTWDAAVSGIYVNKTGGYSDWRMPTIKELYSLIEFSGINGTDKTTSTGYTPFIDASYFGFAYGSGIGNERIIDCQDWSATVYVSTTMRNDATIFGVNFADGRIKGYPKFKPGSAGKVGHQLYVRYVRNNPEYGKNIFQDNSDGTFTDLATNLMWSKDDSKIGMNWHDALAWVQKQNANNYLNHNDWRLPNIKELQSIVDYTRSPSTTNSPAIDVNFFNTSVISNEAGQPDYPYFWSSTILIDGGPVPSGTYISFGRAIGFVGGSWIDVHGAGSQKSDLLTGNPANFPKGRGPQGDAIRINNYIRMVRNAKENTGFHQVKARTNADSPKWNSYTARTIDRLQGFHFTNDPALNTYGSWKVSQSGATGFFRVEKKGDRWWIVDPEGYPFIHKGVAVYRPGSSEGQIAAVKAKYETSESWVQRESQFMKDHGFNGTGAWSDVDLMRQMAQPLVYTVIVNPMGSYKSDHIRKYGGKYEMARRSKRENFITGRYN